MRVLSRALFCAALAAALLPTAAFASELPGTHKGSKVGFANIEKPAAVRKLQSYSLAVVADPREPDDDWLDAPMITGADLPLDEVRSFDPSGDFDHYLLDAVAGTTYTFETITDDDTVIVLYNGDTGEMLGIFDDKDPANDRYDSLGSWTASTGLKHLGVEIFSWDSEAIFDYEMKITSTPGSIHQAAMKRIGGDNRFQVAINAAKVIYGSTWNNGGAGQVSDVIVVCGEDRAMADPLSAAALAGTLGAPLLMTNALTLPVDTSNAIKSIKSYNGGRVKIHVIGGTGSVSPAVYTKLSALKGTGTIERIAGTDRFDLAAKVADRIDTLWMEIEGDHPYAVFVANGENVGSFYDILAASSTMFRQGFPLLLTRNTSVPTSTKSRLTGKFAGSDVIAVNGTTYLPTAVYNGTGADERIVQGSGTDRYSAALAIARWRMGWDCDQSQIIFVNKLPDALAAGTYAGAFGGPLLYTPATGPVGATGTYLTTRKSMVTRASVFGGTASVTDAGYTRISTLLNK